jgi:Rv0078B-related antitoxin
MQIMPSENAGAKAVARLRMALGMFETGVEMMRQKLRRDDPDLPDHEIEARVRAWLQGRPGAESGDAVGRHVSWPRRSE